MFFHLRTTAHTHVNLQYTYITEDLGPAVWIPRHSRGASRPPPAQPQRPPQCTPPATARPGPAHAAAPVAACARPAPHSPAPKSMARRCRRKGSKQVVLGPRIAGRSGHLAADLGRPRRPRGCHCNGAVLLLTPRPSAPHTHTHTARSRTMSLHRKDNLKRLFRRFMSSCRFFSSKRRIRHLFIGISHSRPSDCICPRPPRTNITEYRIQARSTSDGRGPVTRKEFRIGRSQGNLARTPDVAVVIHLKLVFGPCG